MIVLRGFLSKAFIKDFNQENIDKYKSKTNMLCHARYTPGLTKGIILVDKNNDNLIGYISWENDFIIALEVTDNYRNRGIATKLLDYALKQGANKLSVNKKNLRAIKLYYNLGWKLYNEDNNMIYMTHYE